MTTNLFKVNEDDSIAPATNIEINDFELSEFGLVATTKNGNVILVGSAGNIGAPQGSPSSIGLTTAGSAVYLSDNRIYLYDLATEESDEISVSLAFPTLKGLSGNFIVYGDAGTVQVLDTVTKNRFNVADCNGSDVIALSDTVVLINDCNEKQLMNMADGSRAVLDVAGVSMNHENVLVEDGAILISQGCNSDVSLNYDLCHVDSDGVVTTLTTMGFDVGTAGSVFQDGNNVLFSDGDYIIVKELNQVSLVQRGSNAKDGILTGLNILSISVKNGVIFYSAEDIQGRPVLGKYDIAGESSEELASDLIYSKVRQN